MSSAGVPRLMQVCVLSTGLLPAEQAQMMHDLAELICRTCSVSHTVSWAWQLPSVLGLEVKGCQR